MFQGGFVGKDCWIEAATKPDPSAATDFTKHQDFFPDDSNKLQSFDISPPLDPGLTGIRIVFSESTDFFGRITVYQVKLNSD